MNKHDIKTLLQNLVERIGADDTSIEILEFHGRLIFNIQTKDSALLIGKGGETLRSLNHITQRLVEAKSDATTDTKFSVDVNGYNHHRVEFIENQARSLAERVTMFKHEIEMSPMNPYERMIVHEALKGVPHVTTESRGDDKFRHVVIVYKEEKVNPTT